MWKGTASRLMAADRPYGEFCDFYSATPEYFGYLLVSVLFIGLYCSVQQSCLKVHQQTLGSERHQIRGKDLPL
jgi:hypothetical protein